VNKLENGKKAFKINEKWKPAGDQPKAISALCDGLEKGFRHQTLLGVTGSGKTFTMANVIAKVNKPTLVIAHNKTLAAQLALEYKEFFPENEVHYFVSYYDFYQPEAYMPVTDTYIEKEAMINTEIERLRHASTQALLSRRDVIIVASVSCIYGLGSPEEYLKVNYLLEVGQTLKRSDFIRALVDRYFDRTTADLEPGLFRAIGGVVEFMPTNEEMIYRIDLSNDKIESIEKINPVTGRIVENLNRYVIFPAKHFVSDKEQNEKAFKTIKVELDARLAELEKEGKNLEAERLKRRVKYDLALIKEVGYCNGIENYSRHFSGKNAGDPPDTLLSYFPRKDDGTPDFLTVIDESHVTIPQLGAMYAGDASRKNTLVDFGFRLPSARDNRPLKFDEFEARTGQTIYTSATPGKFETANSEKVVEQVIRPTGLIDPLVEVRPILDISKKGKTKNKYSGQIEDFINEAEKTVKSGDRVIATTLTKKMAEDLAEYLKERGLKSEYLHSEIDTLDRIRILNEFRRGSKAGGFDVIVGVNLLREGLDLPEVSLIGVLDADKEGFLRSDTSLIQIIGRAARNVNGKVILYADRITGSMERAISETNRRRDVQIAYNTEHGITPVTIIKKIHSITDEMDVEREKTVESLANLDRAVSKQSNRKLIKEKEKQMSEAVKILDFETAALLRDEIAFLSRKGGRGANKTKK